MEENKQNDLFLTMIANPNNSVQDLFTVGLDLNNTSLRNKEDYKNLDIVQETFKDENGFNEDQFNQTYNAAMHIYNDMAIKDYEKEFAETLKAGKYDIFANPSKRETDPGFELVRIANPYRVTHSMEVLGQIGERQSSIDEIAQTQKVLVNPKEVYDEEGNADWTKAIWHESPNDSFFTDFWDTRVMAAWDEDGVHKDPITGELTQHSAGDLKLNENGTFYYENLDGRNVNGKRVLNKMNTFTVDGSAWNKYDFFDSDDLEQKSFGGAVMRNLALVGTMFIPYVGPAVAALSIAQQSAKLFATLGKMLVGSDSPTLSAIEGFATSIDRHNASEYAQQHTWCMENLVNLIGDVTAQLVEQRVIFEYAPVLFMGKHLPTSEKAYLAARKKMVDDWTAELASKSDESIQAWIKQRSLKGLKPRPEELVTQYGKRQVANALDASLNKWDAFEKSYNKIGEILSKAYMTAITVSDTYGTAKMEGASDEEAMWLTLGYAAAEYALLSTDIGKWVLPELRADRYKNKAIAKALGKVVTDKLDNVVEASAKKVSGETKEAFWQKLFNIGKNIARGEYATGARTLKASLAAAASEGVEEVSEEFLADFSKQCFNWVNQMRGDSTQLTAWNNMLDRYGMSLVGGFIGGGITNVGTQFRSFKNLNQMSYESAVQEIIYMARNKKLDEFRKALDKTPIASKHLSFNFTEEGDFEIAREGNDQNTITKKIVTQFLDNIENTLNAEGGMISDDSFLDIQTRNDLRYVALKNSVTAGIYLQEFNSVLTEIAGLKQQNKTLRDNATKGHTDLQKERNSDGEIDKSTEDLISKNEKRIKELQDRKEAMLQGETSAEFMQDALFEMTDIVSRIFTVPSFVRYVQLVTGKKPGERISPEELSKLQDDYKKYKSNVGKDKIKQGANLYYTLSGTHANILTKQAEYLETLSKDTTLGSVLTALTADMSLNALINNENGLTFADGEDAILHNVSSNLGNQHFNTLLTLINAFGTDVDKEDIKAAVKIPQLAEDASAQEIQEATAQAQKNGQEAIENIAMDNFEQLFTKLIDSVDNLSQQNKTVLLNTLEQLRIAFNNLSSKLLEEVDVPLNFAHLMELEEDEINNFINAKLKSIQDLKQRINEKQEVPIEQFIRDFVLSTDMESTATKLLTDILNKFQMNKKDMSNFLLSDQELNAVQELLTLTDLYEALIEGAKVDNVDIDNPYGLNKTVNELHTKNKNENWIPLAEIDSSLANVILRDLHMFKSQFKLALQIHNLNRGNKIEAVNETTNNKNRVLFNAVQRWIVTVPDSPEKEKLKNILETLKVHKALKLDNLRLNVDDRIALEKEQIKLGDAITEFLSHYKNINDLIKLFEKASDLFEIRQSTLTAETESLDFHSFVAYLSTRYVFSSSAFNGNYKQLIEKNLLDTDTKKLIPIGGQEFATEVSLAFILNKDKFNLMYEAYKQAAFNTFKNQNLDNQLKIINNLIQGNLPKDKVTKDQLEFIFSQELPQFQNITFIEGIAGSGKTGAVFKIIHTYLDTYHKDLIKNSILAHTDDKKATQAAESSGLKVKGISHKQLLNMAIPNQEETLLDKIFINDQGDVDVTVNINEATENLPKIIFIDEIGLLNRFQVLALDKWAAKHGIIIISGGDLVQNTPIQNISVDKTTKLLKNLIPNNTLGISIPVRLSHVMFPASPKLGLSIRTDNQLKTQNSNVIQALVERVVDNIAYSGETVNLQYYEDDTQGLLGDTVISSRTDNISEQNLQKILHTIDLMLATLKEGQKIGYVYHDKYKKIVVEKDAAGNITEREEIIEIKSKLREILEQDKYKDKIIIQSETNAQGLESQYYILDLNYSNELAAENSHQYYEQYVKSLYTGITRSTQGSLIIAPDSKIRLRSQQNQLPPVNETYTTEGVNRAKQVKIQALEGLSEQEIPYVESARIAKPVGKPTSETTLPPAEITGVMNPKYSIGNYVSSSTTTVRIIDIKDNKYRVRNIFTGAEHEFTIDFFEQNFKEIDQNLETIISPFNSSNIKGTLTADGKYTVYFTDDGKQFIVSKEYLQNNFENVDEDLEFAILEQLIVSEDGIKGIFKQYGKSIELDAKSDITKLTNDVITEIPKVQNIDNQEESDVEEVIDNTEDELERLHQEDVDTQVSETEELQTTTSELTNLPTETYETTLIQKEKTAILPSIDEFGDLLDWVFTSHNTVELGVPEDAQGNLQFDINTPRIDSANGLYKLQQQGNSAVSGLSTKEDYLNFIEQLREIIFKTSNKRELENILSNNLGLQNVSVIFAIKTSSLENSIAHKAGKSIEEHLYHMRQDEDQDFNPKQQTISIIIKSGDNQVLELPLLGFMNPITFLTSKLNKYPELLNHWNTTNNDYIHDRVIDFIKTFEGESKYLKIVNQFKLFNLTQNYIYYINNKQNYEDWTIAKNFSKTGPLIFNRATAQQSADGIVSTTNNYLTDEYQEGVQYTTIEEFEQQNPQFQISDIQVARSTIDGVNIKVGYPFVLISERHDIENSLSNYINQELNPTVQKYVTLVYVVPPKVSLETYLNGVYNFIYKQIKPKKPFGDDFTAFKILATLFKSQEFIDSVNDLYNSKELSNNGQTYAEFLISKIEEIEKLPTKEEQNEALRGANSLENWAQWRQQDAKYRLHKLFEGALLKLFYPYNVNTAENVLNENLMTLAQQILAESNVFKDGIFCVTPLVPTEDEHVMLINTEQSDVRPSQFKLPTMSTSQWSGNIFTLINDMFNSMEFNAAGYPQGGDSIDYVYGKQQQKLTKLQYWANNIAKKYNINIDLNLPDTKLFEVIAAELAKIDGVIAINTGNSVIISESEDAKKLKEYIKNTYGNISLKLSKFNIEGEQEVYAGNQSVASYNAETNTITVAINIQNTGQKNQTTTQSVNLNDYADVLNETFSVDGDFSTLLEDFGEDGIAYLLAIVELDEATINNIVNTLKTQYGLQSDENPNQQCNVNYKL